MKVLYEMKLKLNDNKIIEIKYNKLLNKYYEMYKMWSEMYIKNKNKTKFNRVINEIKEINIYKNFYKIADGYRNKIQEDRNKYYLLQKKYNELKNNKNNINDKIKMDNKYLNNRIELLEYQLTSKEKVIKDVKKSYNYELLKNNNEITSLNNIIKKNNNMVNEVNEINNNFKNILKTKEGVIENKNYNIKYLKIKYKEFCEMNRIHLDNINNLKSENNDINLENKKINKKIKLLEEDNKEYKNTIQLYQNSIYQLSNIAKQ